MDGGAEFFGAGEENKSQFRSWWGLMVWVRSEWCEGNSSTS